MSAREAAPRNRRDHGISVLLANDHRILRDGLACVLEGERDIQVIGAVGDGAAAVREVERLLPQVVLMDISMPVLNGIEATRAIVAKGLDTRVVMLSIHGSAHMVRRALEAGASGYVIKESGLEELVKAVRAAAAGKRYLSPALAGRLPIEHRKGKPRGETVEQLTAVETEILRLVTDGKSNTQVAATLGLSPRTVETYRLRLMRKLGIEDLATLVKYAIRHGITSVD
jgi:DNA-binding NarL/FixJ family response regulator